MDDDADIDADIDFAKLLSEHRVLEWQRAAQTVELDLEEWIAITLDRAAKAIRLHAYSTPKRLETAPLSHAERLSETTRKPA
jgi:hypothetical protein